MSVLLTGVSTMLFEYLLSCWQEEVMISKIASDTVSLSPAESRYSPGKFSISEDQNKFPKN